MDQQMKRLGIGWQMIAVIAISCIALLTACVLLLISRISSCEDDAVYDNLAIIANSTPDPYETDLQQYSVSASADPVAKPTPAAEVGSDTESDPDATPPPEPTATPESDYIRVKDYSNMKKNFAALQAINRDCIGWVQIEDTRINYPVVYSKDSQKYLDIGFDGKANRNGTIYATGKDGATARNITLYGHSMSNKDAMFHQVLDYESQRFYNKHKDILYSTPSANYVYHIFAAFPINITGRSFNYTKANFHTDAEFETFITTAIKLSVIDTGETVPKNAHILTLSTCEKGDRRFVVMGYR